MSSQPHPPFQAPVGHVYRANGTSSDDNSYNAIDNATSMYGEWANGGYQYYPLEPPSDVEGELYDPPHEPNDGNSDVAGDVDVEFIWRGFHW